MIILLFVGGIVSLVLLFVMWWYMERFPQSIIAAELDEKFFIQELFTEFVKAVNDNDVVKQEQLKEIAYNRGIIV